MTVKALWAGAGLALVAGLTMGAAMKPNLAGDDRPEGPQVVANWAEAPTGPFDDGRSAVYAAYSGRIPDYVIGTDWTKAMAWPERQAVYVPANYDNDVPTEAIAADYASVDYTLTEADRAPDVPPPADHSFPSIDGGRSYARSPAAPAAVEPALAPRFDTEAPPEATGDTSPAEG